MYVAATRAKDQLIFSGYINSKKGESKNAPKERLCGDDKKINTDGNWMDVFKSIFDICSSDDIPKKKALKREIGFITDKGYIKEKVCCEVEFCKDFDIKESLSEKGSFVAEFKENLKDSHQIEGAKGGETPFLQELFKKVSTKRRFNYNVTMLNSFKTCKRLFYYKYVYGIPEYGFLSGKKGVGKGKYTRIDPAETGNIVHKVLEEWGDYAKGYEPYLKKAVKERNISLTGEHYGDLKGILDNFTGGKVIERLKRADDIKKEATYVTLIDNRKIISKLDCLYLYEGIWHVLDYKTETVTDMGASIEKYKSQLEIYGLAAGLSLDISDIKGEIYFLRPGELKSFDIGIDAVEKETKELIREIESYDYDSFEKTEKVNENCAVCAYAGVCRA